MLLILQWEAQSPEQQWQQKYERDPSGSPAAWEQVKIT